jgi:hypothetical protein
MSLQPQIEILAQDTELYASVTVQDTTGVYNASTNVGGYGTPNPASGDVVKTMIGAEYLGSTAAAAFEEIPSLEVLGAGTVWTHSFLEGVTRLLYLVGVDIVGGGFTGLLGNLNFTLANADTLLEGATYIEIEGTIYKLDLAQGLSSTGGYVTTPFVADHLDVSGTQFFVGQAYSLWNTAGKKALELEIGDVACTSLQCGAFQLEVLMARHRFYLATGYEFDRGNYSKAHNLAVALSPDVTTANCPTC